MTNSSKLSKEGGQRRTFGMLVAAFSGAALGAFIERKIPFRELWERNGFLISGRPYRVDDIESVVPPGMEAANIPETNDQYRKADQILAEGLDIYNGWFKKDPNLKKLYYDKPPNYVDIPSLSINLGEQIGNIRASVADGDYYWYREIAPSLLDEYDIPYARFIEGSRAGISDLAQMVTIDPGTGFVKKLQVDMSEKYGYNFDLWGGCRSGEIPPDQREFIRSKFENWYQGAMAYVTQQKDTQGTPISTSILFAYFLHKNQGDILASAWDTSVWLKITSRNDPNNDLHYDPNYQRAELMCDLFIDEFSPEISANWVVDNIEGDNALLNYVGVPTRFSEFKDFMPPNRAGGFYHAWNIIALSMCVSHEIVKRMVASHINPDHKNGVLESLEYGRQKTWADALVVDRSDEIFSLVKQYVIEEK